MVTDVTGKNTNYTYGAGIFANCLQKVTTPAGKTTTFEYYANRQVAGITEAGGRVMRLSYLPMRNETIFIDDRGFATSYFYNALGNVTSVIQPDGTIRYAQHIRRTRKSHH